MNFLVKKGDRITEETVKSGDRTYGDGPRSRPKRQDGSHSDHLAGLKE